MKIILSIFALLVLIGGGYFFYLNNIDETINSAGYESSLDAYEKASEKKRKETRQKVLDERCVNWSEYFDTKNACFMDLALYVDGDFETCYLMEDTSWADLCVMSFAQLKNEPSLCLKIKEFSTNDCYFDVAKYNKVADVCELISIKEGAKNCAEQIRALSIETDTQQNNKQKIELSNDTDLSQKISNSSLDESVNRSINVITPGYREELFTGKTYDVIWTDFDNSQKINIYLETLNDEYDIDGTMTKIASDITDVGKYSFIVPEGKIKNVYRFNFYLLDENSLVGKSDFFRISDFGNHSAIVNMANARSQAELHYDMNKNSYAGVCLEKNPYSIYLNLHNAEENVGYKTNCNDSKDSWAAEIQLKNEEGFYCVDSSGFRGVVNASKGVNSLSCN